jgi:hypothetical protein
MINQINTIYLSNNRSIILSTQLPSSKSKIASMMSPTLFQTQNSNNTSDPRRHAFAINLGSIFMPNFNLQSKSLRQSRSSSCPRLATFFGSDFSTVRHMADFDGIQAIREVIPRGNGMWGASGFKMGMGMWQ